MGAAQGAQVTPEVSDPTRVSVMLEYSPKALNDAAKGADWEAEVAILLGLFAVLWRCSRAAVVAQSEAGEVRNPYTVTINPIAWARAGGSPARTSSGRACARW